MVEIDVNGESVEWIVDHELAHEVWNKINNSPRVRFTEGVAMLFKLVNKFGSDTNLVRVAGEDIEGPDDWAEPFSLAEPRMRMSFDFTWKAKDDNPNEIRLAVYSRTNNGANFTHEFYQERGEPARAIIRVPVPTELREEALSIADGHDNCEMIREQTGAFNERFNITDNDAPLEYYEPHIECTGVKDGRHLMEVFDEVLDVVERGVRVSS